MRGTSATAVVGCLHGIHICKKMRFSIDSKVEFVENVKIGSKVLSQISEDRRDPLVTGQGDGS